jgi:hypothetical protein
MVFFTGTLPPEAGKAARLKSSFVVISMESGTLRPVSVNAVGAPPAHSRQLSSPAASSNGNSPNAPTARSLRPGLVIACMT